MPPRNHRHHAAVAHRWPSKPNPKLFSFFFFSLAIVMTVVISFFFFLIGVFAILLLQVCLHRGTPRRLRRGSNFFMSSGYSAEDLQKFPGFRFDGPGGEAARECVVCLEGLREGEWCRSLPGCSHIFHSDCVDKWLIKVPACPTCRAPVRLDMGSARSVEAAEECKHLWTIGG